jgi:hypothetical protein
MSHKSNSTPEFDPNSSQEQLPASNENGSIIRVIHEEELEEIHE